MRKCIVQKFPIVLFSLFCFMKHPLAQSVQPDTGFQKKAIEHVLSLYHEQIGNQAGLFNGVNYYGYPFPFEQGHPYFNSSNPELGSIVYDNILYPAVLLSYDQVAEVVILHQNNRSIQLLSEKITGFEISSHRFIKIVEDDETTNAPKAGFYELLYEGNVAVLKKETKKINDYIRTKGEGVLKNIDTETRYYIKNKSRFYSVKNKQSVLQAFQDNKDKMVNFIESRQLNFKREKERMLTEVAAYYDQQKK